MTSQAPPSDDKPGDTRPRSKLGKAGRTTARYKRMARTQRYQTLTDDEIKELAAQRLATQTQAATKSAVRWPSEPGTEGNGRAESPDSRAESDVEIELESGDILPITDDVATESDAVASMPDAMFQTAEMPRLTSFETGDDSVMVGGYMLLEIIGRGGAATVYRAMNAVTEKEVALKVLDKGRFTNQGRKRFEQEMRICRSLRHPNLVETFDIGTWNEHVFYAMEILDGQDLGAVLESPDEVAIADALRWGAAACEGLAQAHDAGIFHRDIKPSNLFLTTAGHIKVVDFGIARVAASPVTRQGEEAILGTPMYIAPERLLGDAGSDARTDVYSLGVALYHLIAKRPPWHARDLATLFTKIVKGEPRMLSSLRPDISDEAEAVIMTAMAKDIEDRFSDCRVFAEALRSVS